jgi:hypothetical protein
MSLANDHSTLHSYKRNRYFVKVGLLVISLILLIIAITRVPYFGSVLDTYLFEFFFGAAKFIIYIVLFVLIFNSGFELRLFANIHKKNG